MSRSQLAREVEPMLTPREVAALFRVNPQTVSRWAQTGLLAAIRTPGRRFLIPESAARAHLEERRGNDRGVVVRS